MSNKFKFTALLGKLQISLLKFDIFIELDYAMYFK